ncbi:MAG: stage II sporulation protein M [Desulfosarcina sp.]|nr:stage II sporulation protein M [Desulfobacterales bacterium]
MRKVYIIISKIATYAIDPQIRVYLENIVGRAYSEIYTIRGQAHRFTPWRWLWGTFPQTFRRHLALFLLSAGILLAGGVFGALAVGLDGEAKQVLMPFSHLAGDPSDRVDREEQADGHKRLDGRMAPFSSQLMTHNTKVAIFAMALGMSWGIGTVLLVFYNGAILGAVILDYIRAGESVFLAGWLLPHGAFEIPAILIGSQAGLVLASALIGWGRPVPMRTRLKAVRGDLVTLIGGGGLMLVWAGLVEAFFSQYHAPVLPYGLKIGFGVLELLLLGLFFGWAGRSTVWRKCVARRPSGKAP